ncbi:DUF6049 family protein [Streptomyces sp. NPDC020412]|uniref:DUF6049 family protein n=1 Tax=Streptomyces sp. NPDC020412 TaxID=3365073 RepID=UPI00379C033D
MAEAAAFRRTTRSPARRWLRRTGAWLATAPLAAGVLAGPLAPVAQAAEPMSAPAAQSAPQTAPAAKNARTVDVSLNTLTPSAPREGDTLTITGTVTNKGKQTVKKADIGLRVGPALSGRTAIDRAAKRAGYDPGTDGSGIDGKYTVKLPALASGISHDFSISVPVDDLDLGADGVYPVGVALSGQPPNAPYQDVLGFQRTFLPWQPDALGDKPQFTYLWPLISSAHLTSDVGEDEQRTPVFEDEELAKELAPSGRLGQLVSLGSELPVTWVVDPDLLATVDAMTRNYRVKNGTETVPGKNQALAKQWLSSLQAAIQDDKVIALPYADPDLASLAHRGKNVSGSLSHLQQATEVAERTVETVLHVEPSMDFAWPVEGAIDSSIVDVATSAGASNVIARSDSLEDDLQYTASAARPIGGGTTAVVADARLSKAFQSSMLHSEASTLAVQQFLAQSLAVARQDHDGPRSIVVAPQRVPTAAQAQAMAHAVKQLSDERWTQQVDLVAAAEVKPDEAASRQVPSTSRYPAHLRKQELTVRTFEDIRATQTALDKFTVILTARDRVETPFSRAIDREMSNSWRGNRTAAAEYRTDVEQSLRALTGEVQLIEKSQITLSGRSATIPVTVQNRLLQDVDNLVLRLSSDNAARLSLDGDKGVAERPIEVKAGHSQSVKFDALANANGQVRMTAQLYTEDNKPYGEKMQFTVKVSEATPTVLLVIAGGVLLLVLAGVRMYTQRKRAGGSGPAGENGSAAGDGPEPTPDGGTAPEETQPSKDDAEAPDPGQPSDPTPDTGPESGNPSVAGEKVDR